MLLPFLPFVIALATLSALLVVPGGAVPTGGSPLAVLVLYVALPVLGALIGQLPGRWLGSRSPLHLAPRRVLHMAVWLGTVAATPVQDGLTALLAGWPGAQEAVLALLFLNFWLSDALALVPLRLMPARTLRVDLARLSIVLRVPLPVVALMLVGLTLPLASGVLPAVPGGAWLHVPGTLVLYLVLAAVALPVLVRHAWGLKPLQNPAAAQAAAEELAANGVRVRAVLAWPDAMTGTATAGVIGLLPRFRYLLFSETLAGRMTPTEVRAVVAHESAHLRHHHLAFFLLAMLGFFLLLQGVMAAVWMAGVISGTTVPVWLLLGLELAGLVLFFRYGLGFLSRNFERQADAHALRRLGYLPFESAMAKVAAVNGIPVEEVNWHHYGVGQRLSYLSQGAASPAVLDGHDRRVRRVKLGVVAALVLALGGYLAVTNTGLPLMLAEQYWQQRLAGDATPDPADAAGARFLAMAAYREGRLAQAERYFRMVLEVAPNDAQSRNNLAWLLVTEADAPPAQLAEGLRLARQAAAELEQAYVLDTLAEAYYRNGRPAEAARAADRALALARAGQGDGGEPLTYYEARLQDFTRQQSGTQS